MAICCPANHVLVYVCAEVAQKSAKSGSGTLSAGVGKCGNIRDVPTALPWRGRLPWTIATAPLPCSLNYPTSKRGQHHVDPQLHEVWGMGVVGTTRAIISVVFVLAAGKSSSGDHVSWCLPGSGGFTEGSVTMLL